MTLTDNANDVNDAMEGRIMSDNDFATLGLNALAYVRPVTVQGTTAYSVHAADGSEIALLDDREVALATIRLHDMEAMAVQ